MTNPTCYELAQWRASGGLDDFLGRVLASQHREPVIRYAALDDRNQVFNEFIATGVGIHLEATGQAQWWMSVRHPDGRMWFIELGAVNDRAKGYAHCDLVEQPNERSPR